MKLNTEEIKHIRDLTLADSINGNDKTINGSILRKLDEQLTIPSIRGVFPMWTEIHIQPLDIDNINDSKVFWIKHPQVKWSVYDEDLTINLT